jgi:hypothetical protein
MTDFITPPQGPHETERWYQELCRIVNKRAVTVPTDSVEAGSPTTAEFNARLAALRAAFE